MKNKIKFTGIIALVAVMVFAMIACDTNPPTFTVSFNSSGGSAIADISNVASGSTIIKPVDPTKDGNDFAGWYKEAGLTNAWNFATDTVTANITLYAKWTPSELNSENLSSTAGANVIEKAVNYVNAHPGTYTLTLTSDVENVNPQTLNANNSSLTITSTSDVTIRLGSNGSLFTVGGTNVSNARSAKLIIGGSTSLQGKADNNAFLVTVQYGGNLELKDSAKISGNTDVGDGSGGGVLVENGTFTMTGGTISDNTGSGVDAILNSSFTMTGGAISGNTNGGVRAILNSSFTMTGGTISGNIVGYGGGGVFIENGTFTMTGGTISGNTATNLLYYGTGGGVYVRGEATFTMNGGAISGNTADEHGGGVSLGGGTTTFAMNGGTISGNTANSGGGVGGGGKETTFAMNGGTISGNTATNSGGGVGVLFGSFRMSNGTIYGSDAEAGLKNIAAHEGAALYVNTGTAQRGTFTGDEWTSKGDLATTDNTINVVDGNLQ